MITDFTDPLEIARAVWKYKFWILVPVVIGGIGAQLAIRSVEPEYAASTLVMVEPQKVPSAYVRTTVTSQLEDRLKTLEQQIKNRSTMERLVTEANLYPEDREYFPVDELISWAQASLSIRVERGQIVRITYYSTDPAEAARAANTIAGFFIEENLNLREKQAQNTTGFLEEEVERTKRQLEEKEAKVSEYRLKNAGSLPDQREANLAAIAQLERLLDQNRARTEDAELRLFILTRQDDLETQSLVLPPSPEGSRLDELELELERLRAQFTDKHPDVVRLKTEIENLREREKLRAGASTTSIDSEVEPSEVDMEVSNLETELLRLESEREELLSDISRYQRRLEATPRIEQELISLTRDYDNLRGSYEDLLSKLIEARLAEELERKQQSEQFKILEEATPPVFPTYPNHLIFNLVGLLLGGGVGVGLAFARDYLDDTFTDESTLTKAFPGVGTVISIPHLTRDGQGEEEGGSTEEQKSA